MPAQLPLTTRRQSFHSNHKLLQTVKEEISVLAELPLYVREQDAPDLYKMSEEDGVEVGPFTVSCRCCCF